MYRLILQCILASRGAFQVADGKLIFVAAFCKNFGPFVEEVFLLGSRDTRVNLFFIFLLFSIL